MAYAFVRNLKTTSGANLKDFAQIQSAERHAKREDLTSQARQRADGDHRHNHFWSRAGEGLDGGGADYAAAFKAHKAAHGIKTERKGAALGLHLLVGVSPEWLAEKGDPRDLSNPRVAELIDHARTWAESWMGAGAVWAVRYDTDEAGAGVVDILASPVRENRAGKAKTGKPSISVNKALKELQEAHGERTSYSAMQTSWAHYSHAHLDPALQRGQPESRQGHLTPEQFKARLVAEEATKLARREALRATEKAKEAQRQVDDLESRLAPLRTAVALLDAHEAAEEQRREEGRKAMIEEKGAQMFRELVLSPVRRFEDIGLAAWAALHPEESEDFREALKINSQDTIQIILEKVRDGRNDNYNAISETHSNLICQYYIYTVENSRRYFSRGSSWPDMLHVMDKDSQRIVNWVKNRVVALLVEAAMAHGWKPEPAPVAATPALSLDEPVREALRQTAPLNRSTGPSFF
ncbi:MAG: hypothetical protein WAQ27_06355 [Candidatus Microsaccharimonas sp.]